MRRPIVPCAILLALVTGTVLGQSRSVFTTSIPLNSSVVDANIELIQRFYEAANQTFETGDANTIDRVVAEDYIEHAARPGIDQTREGLVRYLRSLHATTPSLRLTVLAVVAQHDRVVAHVRVENTVGNFLGLPVTSDGVWGAIDIFRVERHRIVEHWGDQESRRVLEPLATTSISLAGSPWRVITVERRTYAPGASERVLAVDGPILCWVESGHPTVEVDGRSPASAVLKTAAGDRLDADWTMRPGDRVTLKPGDAVAIPPSVPFTTRNDEREPAVVIVVSIGLPPSVGAMFRGADAPPTAPGITTELLAGGSAVPAPVGPLTLALGRATLARNSDLSGPRAQGPVVVAVKMGRLILTVPEGDALVRGEFSSVTAHPYQELLAGQAVMISPGSVVAYRNDGTEPLSLLIVTLTPVPVGSDPSSAPTG